MVVNVDRSSPRHGQKHTFDPAAGHVPGAVGPREAHRTAEEVTVSKGDTKAVSRRGSDTTLEAADDGEDDCSPIQQPNQGSCDQQSGLLGLLPTIKGEISSDNLNAASGAGSLKKSESCPPLHSSSSVYKETLKPALRSSQSLGKAGVRVHWAPEVYDPPCSMASHTKGKLKPALVSRRAKKYQSGKGGSHGKGKKHNRSENRSSSSKSACPAPNPAPCNVAVVGTSLESSPEDTGSQVHELPTDSQVMSSEVSAAADGVPTDEVLPSDVQGGGSAEVLSPPLIVSPVLQTDFSESQSDDSDSSKTPSPVNRKSGKKRSKGGSGKGSSARPNLPDVGLKSLLDEACSKRLAGASALAAGDFDTARELLLGALVSARSLKADGEEGRCLRMLADTQDGEQRENSLSSAVKAFEATSLVFDHAEALLCLAQHMVHEVLQEYFAGRSCWRKSLENYNIVKPSCVAILQAAKIHLRYASTLLLQNQLVPLGSPSVTLSKSSVMLDSPTARRRKSKGHQLLAAELTAAAVVMGSICEVWGKICLLLQEYDEAHAHLLSASNNKLWCEDSPEEAMHVFDLLDSLGGGSRPETSLPRACSVY